MSFLPDTPLILHGGCNCTAIRYTLSIPDISERPIWTTSAESNGQGDIRSPLFCVCHCDDCRRAWGSPITFGIMCPRKHVTFSCLRKESPALPVREKTSPRPNDLAIEKASQNERLHFSAEEASYPGPATEGTFLAFYNTTKPVWRSFCARCGTSISYAQVPWPEKLMSTMPTIDLPMGTLDREDVIKESIRPDRHIGWDWGVDWAKRMVSGDSLPKHPEHSFAQFA